MTPQLERVIDLRDTAKKELLEAREFYKKMYERHAKEAAIAEKRLPELEEEFAAWEKLVETMRNESR